MEAKQAARVAALAAEDRAVLAGIAAGRANDHIAAELGISTGTVKSASSRAREKLRDLLTELPA